MRNDSTAAKILRRKNADERKAYWDSLPIEEKIKVVEARPGNSQRELSKLYKKLEESKK